MPFLMVNLDDAGDCRRALHQLRRRVRRMENQGCEPGREGPPEGRRGPGGPRGEVPGGHDREQGDRDRGGPGRGMGRKKHGRRGRPGGPIDPNATLKQKLQRVRTRGVWRFLSGIARLNDQPRSLAELDEALDLQKNKMRSTKAIFAKLENRLDVQFLVVDPEGQQDEAGNPRYVMPKRIRKQIRNLIDE
ncbi:MAG: hypothetical protein WBD20_11230 [Pirellulaceae bacterium]